ncbi:MAG: HTH domain-containing protein [Bacilli bacterium]|nr:HTH domain-containing protein [Bacilli bacterium]
MDLRYSYLFDYYGELFTDKQKEYFTDYYFNNLTLQEIADNNNVSRNAVHKNIKDILSKLDYYEEKLNLYNNKKKIEKLIENIDVDIKNKIEELI